jgi:ABC-type branched-subunit amino acid transport system substrate-binding protein
MFASSIQSHIILKHKFISRSFCAFLLIFLLSGCGQHTQIIRAPQPVINPLTPGDVNTDGGKVEKMTIALMLPLSGRGEKTGRALLDAAKLALYDLAGDALVFKPYDTRGSVRRTEKLAQDAIADGVDLIIGPLYASTTKAVAPLAKMANIPVLSFSNSALAATPGVFTLGFTPEQQVESIGHYIISRGYHRIAMLTPDNSYGKLATGRMKKIAAQSGVEIIRSMQYDKDDHRLYQMMKVFTNYDKRLPHIQKLREQQQNKEDITAKIPPLPYDAIFIPDNAVTLEKIGSLLTSFLVEPDEVKLFGPFSWNSIEMTQSEHLIGSWYAAPAPKERQKFQTRFKATYGYLPDSVASLAYDSVALAVSFIREKRKVTVNGLMTPHGFNGVDGPFRFTPDGRVERRYAVLEVRSNHKNVVAPAVGVFN